MSELAIKMTSDDQQVSAAVQRLDQGVKQVEKSFDSAAVASQKSADAAVRATTAQSKLAAEGKRIADSLLRQNEDLSESWERQKNAINEAHRDGKLSADQHQRALELLEKKISDTAAANRAKARAATEAAEAEKRAALESTEAYQTQQRAIKEGIALTQRLEDKNRTLSERYDILRQRIKAAFDGGKISAEQYRTAVDQVTQEQRELEAAQHKSVGPSAMAQVSKLAAGYLSISSAIGVARQALAAYNAERDKGRSQTELLQEARQNLAQVSQGDLGELESRADAAASRYGVSRVAARQVLFSARSEGWEKDYERVLAMSQLIPPEAASRVAGQTNQIFGGKFTAEQIISGVYKGSVDSRLDFAPMAEMLPQAAEGANLAGASAEETIATLAILASKFNNAGDRIKALGSRIGTDRGVAAETDEEFASRKSRESDRAKNARLRFRNLEEKVQDAERRLSQEMSDATSGSTADEMSVSETERRQIESAELSVARAKRALTEFDEGSLSEAKLVRNKGRRSIAGLGFDRAITEMQSWSEAERNEFLGKDSEVNAAYKYYLEERDRIRLQEQAIRAEMSRSGTPDSLIRQRLSERANDRTQSAFLDSQREKIKNEIASENAYSADISNFEAYREWVNTERAENRIGFSEWAGERARIWATRSSGLTLEEGLATDERIDSLFDRYLAEKELQKQTELLKQIRDGITDPSLSQQQNPNQVPVTRPNEDK